MSIKNIATFFLLLILTSGQAQTMEYAVFKGKKRIGTQKVIRDASVEKVEYQIKSDVEFRIMGKRNMIFTIESSFESGLMEHCFATEFMNNKTRHHGETVRQEDSYIYKDGSTVSSLPLSSPIEWTVSRMYFEEPVGVNWIYAERHGQYLELKLTEDGRYDLILPNNRKTGYRYVEGICQTVEVDHWAASVRMEKI